jgi:hypothetical protein
MPPLAGEMFSAQNSDSSEFAENSRHQPRFPNAIFPHPSRQPLNSTTMSKDTTNVDFSKCIGFKYDPVPVSPTAHNGRMAMARLLTTLDR